MNIPTKMKAAVLMAPNLLEIKQVDTPQPGPADVLIRVEACAVCSSDLSMMAKPWKAQPPYESFIPGHEYAGTVVGLGETVDEFKVGDRVAVEAEAFGKLTNGKIYHSPLHLLVEVRDGKIQAVREYMDTYHV